MDGGVGGGTLLQLRQIEPVVPDQCNSGGAQEEKKKHFAP